MLNGKIIKTLSVLKPDFQEPELIKQTTLDDLSMTTITLEILIHSNKGE